MSADGRVCCSVQVVSVLALLSTCQPCASKASTTCPTGQIPFYQPTCTALAHVMPGGNYGSQTVSCYTATSAHQAMQNNFWGWSDIDAFQSNCGAPKQSGCTWSAPVTPPPCTYCPPAPPTPPTCATAPPPPKAAPPPPVANCGSTPSFPPSAFSELTVLVSPPVNQVPQLLVCRTLPRGPGHQIVPSRCSSNRVSRAFICC